MICKGSSPTQEYPLTDPIFTYNKSSPHKGKGYAIPVQALRVPEVWDVQIS